MPDLNNFQPSSPSEEKITATCRKYQSDCVKFLQKLIRTPSVNGVHNELAIADLIVQECRSLGLPAQKLSAVRGRPNVYVGKKDSFSDPQTMLLVANSDTVPPGNEEQWSFPPFSGKIKDNKIWGRGAVDCKGGIAVNIYSLKILQDLGFGNLAKAIIGVDEESGADSQIGIRYVLLRGLQAAGAVYSYGGESNNKMNIGHRGVLRIWVRCRGESAHTGSRHWQNGIQGASAINGLMSFLERVKLYGQMISKVRDPYFTDYHCVITPTLIEGGSGESQVPDEARVLLDIRTLPGQESQVILGELKKIAASVTNNSKLRFDFMVKNDVLPALSDPEHPFVQKAAQIKSRIYGIPEVTLRGSGPANEAHLLISHNIPTVVGFGPSGNGYHSCDEYAELDSIESSLRYLTTLSLDSH